MVNRERQNLKSNDLFFNQIIDHQYGYEEVTKQCGAKEVSGLLYEEGCEISEIPYKRKECYCKQNLCNSSKHVTQNVNVIVINLTIYSIIYFS